MIKILCISQRLKVRSQRVAFSDLQQLVMALLSGIACKSSVCFEIFKRFSCLQQTKSHIMKREKALNYFTNKEVHMGLLTH